MQNIFTSVIRKNTYAAFTGLNLKLSIISVTSYNFIYLRICFFHFLSGYLTFSSLLAMRFFENSL